MSVSTLERPSNYVPLLHGHISPINFKTAEVGSTIKKLSFDPNEAERGKHLSLDQMRKEVAKNLEGFKGEVLDDIPVSHRYSYYYDSEGNVFNHPDRLPIHRFETQFDPRERDGMPQEGFKKATELLLNNPNVTVMWYSPPGEASLDKTPNNPYSDVTFIYGQLYVMNFDGQKINGVAVKVDRDGEQAIEQFMPDVFWEANKASTDYERAARLIRNPSVLAGNISDVVAHAWNDGTVYSGKEGGVTKQKLTVSQMMETLKQRFGDDDSHTGEFDDMVKNLTLRQLTDKGVIAKLYLRMILGHSSMQRDGQTSLKGACGGSNVTKSEIEELLGVGRFGPVNSSYRLMTQGDYLKQFLTGQATNETTTHHESYNCPHCNQTLSGESKTDKSSWRKACDHCGGVIGC